MTDDTVVVSREAAEVAVEELEDTAEYIDLSEQSDRFTRLLDASESIRDSLQENE